MSKDYVEAIYNETARPFTEYPGQLCRYLYERYHLKSARTLLDVGCGRGEFLQGFVDCGLKGVGIDQSVAARTYYPDLDVRQADITSDALPVGDASVDYVFSKSVLEHFYYPEKLARELLRVVKPGGLVITMVPDWESVYTTFYDDYTHRTPFTVRSIVDFFEIQGFEQVKAEKFIQLPGVWKYPGLRIGCRILNWLTWNHLKAYSKVIRFAKEGMLLCSAQKPKDTCDALEEK